MFKRSSVRYGHAPVPETPYQKAAQVWDDRIGSSRVQARNWRLMAFGCLALAAGLAGGLAWQAARGTITPWVVEVDRLGQAQAIAPADASYRPTDPQIAFHLARFIEDVRGLPGPQARVHECAGRSEDDECRSSGAARFAVCAAGWRRHSRGIDHRLTVRPAGADYRPSDRERL
jgi:type IV secretory pathway TrbF-like protein